MKSIVIFSFLVIVLSTSCVSYKDFSNIDTELISCKSYYVYSRYYRSDLTKEQIINIWKQKGYLVQDTIMDFGNKMLYQTNIFNVVLEKDTIPYVNFQIFEFKQPTSIHFHGMCLDYENIVEKEQVELKRYRPKIENALLDFIPKEKRISSFIDF